MNLQHDKLLHFLAGGLIAANVGLFVDDPVAGLGAAIIAGLVKEAYDAHSETGTPEVMDLVWTIIGGFLGAGVVYLLFDFAYPSVNFGFGG